MREIRISRGVLVIFLIYVFLSPINIYAGTPPGSLTTLNPTIVGSVKMPDVAFEVHVSGAYAYVADWDSGLQVIRIFGTPESAWTQISTSDADN